jgi:hypothetical protein
VRRIKSDGRCVMQEFRINSNVRQSTKEIGLAGMASQHSQGIVVEHLRLEVVRRPIMLIFSTSQRRWNLALPFLGVKAYRILKCLNEHVSRAETTELTTFRLVQSSDEQFKYATHSPYILHYSTTNKYRACMYCRHKNLWLRVGRKRGCKGSRNRCLILL